MERILFDEQFKKETYSAFALAMDIGATKTRIGIVGKKGARCAVVFADYHLTADIKDQDALAHLMNATLKEAHERFGITVSTAGIALAGIARDGKGKLTNGDLSIDAQRIKSQSMLADVRVFNDLEAAAAGISCLPDEEIIHLNDAQHARTGCAIVVQPGSGLGVGMLHDGEARASEAGHIRFAATNDLEWVLGKFLKSNKTKEHPEYEDVLSAKGLYHIYQYLQSIQYADQLTAVRHAVADAQEKSAAILKHPHDPVCRKAIDMYVKLLADFCQHLALATLPFQGIFLTGSLIQEFEPELRETFIKGLASSKSMGGLLAKAPVFLVRTEELGLIGAASLCL